VDRSALHTEGEADKEEREGKRKEDGEKMKRESEENRKGKRKG
jgi:hypothetical protein